MASCMVAGGSCTGTRCSTPFRRWTVHALGDGLNVPFCAMRLARRLDFMRGQAPRDRGETINFRNLKRSQQRGNSMTIGRPFQKGQSGNPGGRPKEIAEVKELARQHTPAAIEVLASIMHNTKASDAARVSAASALLDRGYGKPQQH